MSMNQTPVAPVVSTERVTSLQNCLPRLTNILTAFPPKLRLLQNDFHRSIACSVPRWQFGGGRFCASRLV